jgi:lipopolysaccharide export system protein LptA
MILVFTYLNHNTNEVRSDLENSSNIINTLTTKDDPNIILNLKYVAKEQNGSEYIITSEKGVLNEESPELILMNKVLATINIKNSNPIEISSEKALYNSVNFNTQFYGNVLMIHEENIITSDNLDLMFQDNMATITNNVIYKNLNTKMFADKIEINLITKNSKIFMNSGSKKVKIVRIN